MIEHPHKGTIEKKRYSMTMKTYYGSNCVYDKIEVFSEVILTEDGEIVVMSENKLRN